MEYYSTNHMFGDGGRPIYYNLHCSGCESTLEHAAKTHTQTPIALEGQSPE